MTCYVCHGDGNGGDRPCWKCDGTGHMSDLFPARLEVGDLDLQYGYVIEWTDKHTCGAGDHGQHEPGCGWIPVCEAWQWMTETVSGSLLDELFAAKNATTQLEAVRELADDWDRECAQTEVTERDAIAVSRRVAMQQCAATIRAILEGGKR